MNENMLFVRSRHNRLILSLLSFEKKKKMGANFLDGCYPNPGSARVP
jgi:hypothetical protein